MKKYNATPPKLIHGASRGGKWQIHVGGEHVSSHDTLPRARRTAMAIRKHLRANQEGYDPTWVKTKKAW